MNDIASLPAREDCQVRYTVSIDGVERSVTAHATTTGSAAITACKMLWSGRQDIRKTISDMEAEAAGTARHDDRRRAVMAFIVDIAGVRLQVGSDVVTTGDVYEAAQALASAATNEIENAIREDARFA